MTSSNRASSTEPGAGAPFLLVDQSLRDTQGHHFSYAASVARAASALGMATSIFASRHYDVTLSVGVPVHPWFSQSWTESESEGGFSRLDGLRERVLRTLRDRPAFAPFYLAARSAFGVLVRRFRSNFAGAGGNGKFYEEFRHLLESEHVTPGAQIFIPTLSVGEARDCFRALADVRDLPESTRIHLLFRRDPDENSVRNSLVGSFQDVLRSIADSPLHQRVLRFYSDTEDLSREYSRLSRFRFEALPLPTRAVGSPVRTGEVITLIYLGDARGEKGFHLLPEALERVSGTEWKSRVRFVIQANPARKSGDERGIAEARERLRRVPGVTLLEKMLSDDEYASHLSQADAVIIPYQRLPYRYRSSGVLAEAMVAGKPVIVPSGTWMSKVADPGSRVCFESGAGDLAGAICRLLGEFESYKSAALANCQTWKDRHCAEAVVSELIRAVR